MDLQTAEVAVRTFAKLSEGNGLASVAIYGGEPLLNAQTTFFVLRLLRQLQREGAFKDGLDLSILTNGSLVDDEAVSVIRETNCGVGVSIDGPRDLHDMARNMARGGGTYGAALSGFRRLQKAGLNPSVSCTLNAHTIRHVDEIVDFMIGELRPRSVGFNLLLPRVGDQSAGSEFDHEYASREVIRAFQKLRRVGIYESRMMRRVRPFVEGRTHLKDCMGVGGQIVVSPSGHVGPCQALLGLDDEKYFPLGIRDLARSEDGSAELIYSNSLFEEWRYRFPFNMSDCSECFAISVCGGGCPYAALVTKGSIWSVDERICFQAKNILEWMVWDAYSNMESV
jgi:radical SAM protein with 4Fe4S-binding SPASM domain